MRSRRPHRRFVPSTPQLIEGRILLSGLGPAIDRLRDQASRAVRDLENSVAPPDAPAVAVVGDGLSAEYQAGGGELPYARGWVEQLAATGRLNFGPYSKAGLGEPRGKGFTLNWAEEGATTADVLKEQVPGLASQLATKRVPYVVVFMGTSDFAKFASEEAPALLDEPAGRFSTRLNEVRSGAEVNLSRTINALQDANPTVRLLVATVPDPTRWPAVAAPLDARGGRGNAALRAVRQAVGRYNRYLRTTLVNDRNAITVDVAGRLEPLSRGTGTMRFGESIVDLGASGNDPLHILLADNRHPGTIAQGLIANQFVGALNAKYEADVKPLGSQEILAIAQAVAPRPT